MNDSAGNFGGTLWRLRSGSANSEAGTLIESLGSSSPGSAALTVLPLTPNTYNMAHISNSVTNATDSATYTFTFNVVPEPASLALLGLGSLALLRRRRTN